DQDLDRRRDLCAHRHRLLLSTDDHRRRRVGTRRQPYRGRSRDDLCARWLCVLNRARPLLNKAPPRGHRRHGEGFTSVSSFPLSCAFCALMATVKKKSRFLQTPIEPFSVEAGLPADRVLARMERISFQGRNLATAHRIWLKMLQDDVTIFMGMAGALSAGGLRMIVAHLIANRYVDCLVSTGANLYHDLHETRGQRHYLGSPPANDPGLPQERTDRSYDPY